MPLCIKGKFYAKAVVAYITTFYAIEFGVKSESWPQSYSYIKGKFYANELNYWGYPLCA